MSDRKDHAGHDPRPELPRSEPEILPPRRSGAGSEAPIWFSVDAHEGTQRIYVARPGPFSIIVALLLVGLVLAAIVVLLLGFVLFWIPVIVFVVAALLLAGYIRYSWARLKLWAAGR